MPETRADAPPHRGWVTDLLLLLMATIWGVNFSVVKFGTQHMAPLAYNSVRVVLAATVLGTVVLASGKPLPPRRTILALLGLGVLGNGLYQVFFVEGISRTRAGNASLVVAASPAIIAVLGQLRGVEKVHLRGYIGIALSILGIGFVMSGALHATAGNSTLLGDFLILCGTATWALYTVLLKPYTHDVDGVQVSAFTMFGGVVPLVAVATPSLLRTEWAAVPSAAWAAVAYSGLGALVVAYLLWYRGIRLIGPTRTAMYSNLQPIVAVLVAWFALGEVPTAAQGLGAACVFAGLILTRS